MARKVMTFASRATVSLTLFAAGLGCSSSDRADQPGDEGGGGDGGSAGAPTSDAEPDADAGPDATEPADERAADGPADGGSAGSVVPVNGALLGAFTSSTPAEVEAALGRRLAIVHKFWAWKDDFVPFIKEQIAAGRLAQVTWEAWQGGVGTPLADIAGGAFDDMIRTRARDAKQAGKPFFLRWGHEMNGNWYPWDGTHNGANADGTQLYIAAFRHLHDLFTAEGATNAIWVFCPNVDAVPNEPWNDWSQYYPGDDYVDWLGFDGYNWGTTQSWGSSWQTFAEIASRIYPTLAAKGKPILIGETASTEIGGDKAAWIQAILPSLRTDFPRIKGMSWFDTNKETDWRIDSSATSLEAFKAMANDPYFNP